jgi:cell division protein FtsI/penicillin-binding protein 2
MIARLFQLQIVEGGEWQRQARSSRLDKDTIPFKRGRITSVNGDVFAEDDFAYDLYFRYRDFRRMHPAGQIHAALILLDVKAPGVEQCMVDAQYWAEQLLQLGPERMAKLSGRARNDLNYYLQGMFDLKSTAQRDGYLSWLDSGELTLGQKFPGAAAYFAEQLKFFEIRITAIEQMLGSNWHKTLLTKIEQRRQRLQLMVLQRSLQDAAARSLQYSSSELRGKLRDSDSRLSTAQLLHQQWQLDGRAEYLAAMLITIDGNAPSEELRQQELSQQVGLLAALWKQVELAAPQDTAGILRDQQYRVHRFRVISFSKDIDYQLVDLLAQQGDDYPGLYLQKVTRRNYPVALIPQIVGTVRLPQESNLAEYRKLNDRFRQLRKMFYRTAEDESEYRKLRHQLWSATLRPDETSGMSGVEDAFEKVLRGVRGYSQVLKGGEDGKLPLDLLYSAPVNGHDVVLSLDIDLIEVAEKSIAKVYVNTRQRLREYFPSTDFPDKFDSARPKVGFALIDLKNNQVPMLATTPLLDRQQYRRDYQELVNLKDSSPLRHRALAGNYWQQETPYPGSTFKPLVAAAALMKDGSLWNKSYRCEGVFQASSSASVLNCDSRYGHQEINMRDALKKSCNIYFYKLARDLGPAPIYNLAKSLGFGSATGFEVPALEKGANYLVDFETLSNNSMRLMRTAIGQVGVHASPLQMARLYGWLATSTLPSASIVVEGGGASPAVDTREVLALPGSYREQIAEALSAVNYELGGTAYKTQFPMKWQIVGKTGTSQVSLGTSPQPTHAWFTGYFPANNPQYSFAIMCENTGLHGGQIASFILKEFLQQAMPQLAPELVVQTDAR